MKHNCIRIQVDAWEIYCQIYLIIKSIAQKADVILYEHEETFYLS